MEGQHKQCAGYLVEIGKVMDGGGCGLEREGPAPAMVVAERKFLEMRGHATVGLSLCFSQGPGVVLQRSI